MEHLGTIWGYPPYKSPTKISPPPAAGPWPSPGLHQSTCSSQGRLGLQEAAASRGHQAAGLQGRQQGVLAEKFMEKVMEKTLELIR